jgi:hypothetical protein
VAQQRVKHEDGTFTAKDIVVDYKGQIDEQLGVIFAAWKQLEPRYRSKGALAFFQACEEINGIGRALMVDIDGVTTALHQSGMEMVRFTDEDEQSALALATANDVGGGTNGTPYQYKITTGY